MEVLRLIRAQLSDDAQVVTAEFETDAQPMSVEMSIAVLRSITEDFAGLIGRARALAAPAYVMNAKGVTRFRAEKAHTGEVLLSLQLDNGLEHHVALPPTDAKLLAKRIAEVAER